MKKATKAGAFVDEYTTALLLNQFWEDISPRIASSN